MPVHVPSKTSALDKKSRCSSVKTDFVISMYFLSTGILSKKKNSFMWQVAMVYGSIIDLKILGEV